MTTIPDDGSTVRVFRTPSGIDIVANVGGDPFGPPVILLHGGGQTRYSWRGAMRELMAHGFNVVNMDSRGHGDSGWSPSGAYCFADYASDLRAVIDVLPSKPALIGSSMGGASALYLVGSTPEPIASAVVMVDIVPRPDLDGAARIVGFMSANPGGFETLDQAAEAVAAHFPERPRPKDNSGLMKTLRLRDGRLHWHWDPDVVRKTMDPSIFTEQLLSACDGVRVPTLLVRGLKSDVVTDVSVAEFRSRLPRLEVLDIIGAGHMVAADRNDAFNQGVIRFLERLPREEPLISDRAAA